MKKTRYMTMCAVFCALGALLPQAFHVFGTAMGQVFLPMHIPAMVAGFLLGPAAGLMTGVISPVLSHVITGGSMPILIKVPLMMLEVGAYGFFCGLFSKKAERVYRVPESIKVLFGVMISQVMGRGIHILGTLFAVKILGVSHKAVSIAAVIGGITTGIPGIGIQLLFVPAAVLSLRKITGFRHSDIHSKP